MSKPSKKRFEKKKQREKQAKVKVAAKRERERVKRKEIEKDERRILRKREKLRPYVKAEDPAWQEEQRLEKLKQIEKNLEVLKALEADYLRKEQDRENLNADLEMEGYETLDQKMQALNEKAQKYAEEKGLSPDGLKVLDPRIPKEIEEKTPSEE